MRLPSFTEFSQPKKKVWSVLTDSNGPVPSFTEFFFYNPTCDYLVLPSSFRLQTSGWMLPIFFYTEFLYGGVAFWFQLRKLFLVVFFLLFFLGFFDFQQSASFFFNGAQPTGSRPLRKSAATVSYFFFALFFARFGCQETATATT